MEEEIQAAVVRCAKVLGCRGWGRADLILRADGSFTPARDQHRPGHDQPLPGAHVGPGGRRAVASRPCASRSWPEPALADDAAPPTSRPAWRQARPARGAPPRVRAGAVARAVGRPQLLNLISDVLMVRAAPPGLATPPWRALSRLPVYPLQEVVVTHAAGPGDHRPARIRGALVACAAISSPSIWTTCAAPSRSCPGCAVPTCAARWPGGVEVRLEEHVASAYWRVGETGDMRLVNRYGEVFTAASNAKMPVLQRARRAVPECCSRIRRVRRASSAPWASSWWASPCRPGEAWQLKLEDGLTIELGHEQAKAATRRSPGRVSWPATPRPGRRLNMNVAVVDLALPQWFCPAGSSRHRQPRASKTAKKGSDEQGIQGTDRRPRYRHLQDHLRGGRGEVRRAPRSDRASARSRRRASRRAWW